MSISDVRTKTIASLERIRKVPTGTNYGDADKAIYDYLVIDTIRSYAEKQREAALEEVRRRIDKPQLARAIGQVMRTGLKAVAMVLKGDVYRVNVEVRNASARLDTGLLEMYLRSNLSLTDNEIQVLFKACTNKGKNPESYTVEDL